MHLKPARGTSHFFSLHALKVIPGETSFLECSSRCVPRVVFQALVIETGVDHGPGKSGCPEAHLSVSDAIFEEVSGIQHMRMPYHQYIYPGNY